jgi:hypothetical protein
MVFGSRDSKTLLWDEVAGIIHRLRLGLAVDLAIFSDTDIVDLGTTRHSSDGNRSRKEKETQTLHVFHIVVMLGSVRLLILFLGR